MPNVMAALCSMPQSLADAQYWTSNLRLLRLGEEKKKKKKKNKPQHENIYGLPIT